MFSLRQLSDKLDYCYGQDLKAEQSTRKPCKHGKGDFNTHTRSVSQPYPTASCITTTLLWLLWNYKKASLPILKQDCQQQKPRQRKISLNHLKTSKWKWKGKKKSLNCLFCTSVKLIFQLLISLRSRFLEWPLNWQLPKSLFSLQDNSQWEVSQPYFKKWAGPLQSKFGTWNHKWNHCFSIVISTVNSNLI